jgi:hypothetical protein
VLDQENRPPNHVLEASNVLERRPDVLWREKDSGLVAMRLWLNHAVRPRRRCR